MAVPASITEFLKRTNAAYAVVAHPTAYTAQEEAAVTHIPGRQWAKTVVCFADGDPILAVLSAHHSVDLERLKGLAGARSVKLAKEEEFAPLYPDCEAGAMPPLGPLYNQRVFVDESVTKEEEIVFNGGTHTDAIKMRYRDFAALVKPVVGEFGRPPGRR
ncbi:MAG: YbaK/EbsC family protein [Gemmatimonadetes bacterium]|nr:YbaK/EbsC family protein [Gemmatimonadota bacterium]